MIVLAYVLGYLLIGMFAARIVRNSILNSYYEQNLANFDTRIKNAKDPQTIENLKNNKYPMSLEYSLSSQGYKTDAAFGVAFTMILWPFVAVIFGAIVSIKWIWSKDVKILKSKAEKEVKKVTSLKQQRQQLDEVADSLVTEADRLGIDTKILKELQALSKEK
jgi:hypothetical protein